MTRRGTLAYYLAAWVIGCFVVSFLQWIGDAIGGDLRPASVLLTTYFFSLVFGAVAVLLFSSLLRLSMRLLGTHNLLAWPLAGGLLALLLIVGFIHAQGALLSLRSGPLGEILIGIALKTADALGGRNLWQVPVDGAITGLVLCLVDRAFAGANKAAEPKHSIA
jgi:hypothetical protein